MRPFQWPSSWILRKMCSASLGECPFQISEHDNEIFEKLKVIDLVEKPLQDEEITGASTVH